MQHNDKEHNNKCSDFNNVPYHLSQVT